MLARSNIASLVFRGKGKNNVFGSRSDFFPIIDVSQQVYFKSNGFANMAKSYAHPVGVGGQDGRLPVRFTMGPRYGVMSKHARGLL